MKRSAVLKGLFSSLMAVAMIFGIVHLSAQPADAAFRCPAQLFGNTFSHVASSGGICCCIYVTPDGDYVEGPSWYC